ncbi:MAG: phosphate signaling complex protein PhoU [Phycisphaerales bacterium]|nr:phosphate signaling complex protein PhoU [Phycisphaerales bacterium]MCI0631530.1 phosphate signaling complex protein PhoU [Phycisphaerales bacterium]MCI0675577.1 phosphate signaling complex protein PhoU [Phycisphaerales bacterium]
MGIDLIHELIEVRRMIMTMASSVERQVDRAVTALINKDIALARLVQSGDDEINHLELDIENECLRIFALTHPVAGDLRFVMAVLRINNNLERIGDKAKTIAKRTIDLTDCAPVALPKALVEMADEARKMLGDALRALANEDTELSRSVRLSDDRVDALQRELFNWAHKEIPAHVESTHAVIDVLSISRALERIADLSTNIAEDVIFIVDGSVVRHSRASRTH